VLAEIRKGYHRYGDTLRLAEVVVNKLTNDSSKK
jgi:molecular chaperone GrpE (heat shock protein)